MQHFLSGLRIHFGRINRRGNAGVINEAGKTKVWGRGEDPRERVMDGPPAPTVYLQPLLLLRGLSRLININALVKEKYILKHLRIAGT